MNGTGNEADPGAPLDSSDQEAYEAPAVIWLGTLAELTLAGTGGGTDGFGGGTGGVTGSI